MPRTVSSTQAKAQLGTLLKWIDQHDDEVIVELYNKPTAVIMTYDEYEEIVKLRRQERQRQAETQTQHTGEIEVRNPEMLVEEASRLAGFLVERLHELARHSTLQTEIVG